MTKKELKERDNLTYEICGNCKDRKLACILDCLYTWELDKSGLHYIVGKK